MSDDYWAGSVALVTFAPAESVVFAWVFWIDRGWAEITGGADMKVPRFYRPVIKYVKPVFLLCVFLGSVISPQGGNWAAAVDGLMAGRGWALDDGSLIRSFLNSGLHDQIARATDPLQVAALEERLFYINASRALLTVVFAGICVMVYIAAKKREGPR